MWSMKWVGIPYDAEHDCVWFVRHVLEQEIGKVVPLPTEMEWLRSPVERVKDMARDVAYPVSAVQDLDGVLMGVVGNSVLRGSHIGLYVNEYESVLHSVKGTGSILTRVRDLKRLHLTIEGFYRWN